MTHWLPWSGLGACPLPKNTSTKIKLRSGKEITTKRPQDWLWGRAVPSNNAGEIVAYCIMRESAVAN